MKIDVIQLNDHNYKIEIGLYRNTRQLFVRQVFEIGLLLEIATFGIFRFLQKVLKQSCQPDVCYEYIYN